MDGVPTAGTDDYRNGAIKPDTSRLYHVVGLPLGGAHVLELEVKGSIRLFSFTFG
jgi:hypothetical protein